MVGIARYAGLLAWVGVRFKMTAVPVSSGSSTVQMILNLVVLGLVTRLLSTPVTVGLHRQKPYERPPAPVIE